MVLFSGLPSEFLCFAALRQHVQSVHKMSFCLLCVDNMNSLVKDHKLYTNEQLKEHKNGKAKESGFEEGRFFLSTNANSPHSISLYCIQVTPSASTARYTTTTPRCCTAI